MDNKLGWYVHSRLAGYRKYGINEPKEGNETTTNYSNIANRNISSIFFTAKNRRVNLKYNENLQEYENFLNDLYKGKRNKQNKNTLLSKNKFRDMFIELLNEWCSNLLNQIYQINWETGTVSYKDNSSLQSEDFHKIKALTEEELQSMKDQVQKMIDFLRDPNNKNERTINDYIDSCETTIIGFNTKLIEGINAVIEIYDLGPTKATSLTNFLTKSHPKDKTSSSAQALSRIYQLRNQFNELLQIIGVIPIGIEYIVGKSAEIAMEKVAILYKNVLDETVDEQISKEVLKKIINESNGISNIGTNQLTVTFDPNRILGGQQFLGNNHSFKQGNNNGYIMASKGQQKVDIEIGWKEHTISDTWNMSIKSLNLNNSYDIHLEGSNLRSLIYHLQEDTIFGTHILNIMATHKDENNNYTNSAYDLMKASLYAKILYNAISGSGFAVDEKNIANLFILLDNSSGKVRIYHIDDLIDKAINLILAKAENATKIVNISVEKYGELFDTKFYNGFVSSSKTNTIAAKQRIVKLLQEIHKAKLEIYLKKSFLNDKDGV